MYVSKNAIRNEAKEQLATFKASGGIVEVLPARKKRKIKLGCTAKGFKSFKTSTKPFGVRTSRWGV
jgi:hypothetical protein